MALIEQSELTLRFAHHPPRTHEVAQLHAEVRDRCLDLAQWLNDNLPPHAVVEGEKAIDAIDDACKHANAAIARRLSGARGTGLSDSGGETS